MPDPPIPPASGELRRLEELFHAALEHPREERAAFLAAADLDQASRAELERWLAADAAAGAEFLAPRDEATALAGRRIAGFRLVRALGQGGMGIVYEAEQERPRRRVALKLLRAHAGRSQAARRLEFEAEVMSRLRHPGIAQIHAAGTLEDEGGTLCWFALELVPGARSLTRYVDEQRADLDQRLDLFAEVCAAVEHGHQRGVIHRDLKPDNVLVGEDGRPKVIDFGVARAVGAGLEPQAAATRAGEILGTLAYMSPEQCRGLPDEVDARSDVYALGVMLFELLTGERPHDLAGRPVTEALRAIVESEPRRPRGLRPSLPRDLETVVLTALAREPERRYASVGALAADLARFRAHQPIAARPPSLLRGLLLAIRRHRAVTGAALAAVLALVLATVVSTRSAARAARAAEREQDARLGTEAVNSFLSSILTSARPSRALGRELSVRELVDDARHQALRELSGRPRALVEVLATLGTTYVLLGRPGEAEETFRVALETLDGAPGIDPDGSLRASVRSHLGQALVDHGQLDAAAEELQAALAAQSGSARALSLYRLAEARRVRGDWDAAEALLEEALEVGATGGERALALGSLSALAALRRDLPRAEELAREALAIHAAELPEDHPVVAGARNALANVLFERGAIDEAEELWTRALATFERVLAPDHPDVATLIGNLALLYQRRGDFERSEAAFLRAIELRAAALGELHPRLLETRNRYALMLVARGEPARAAQELARALDLQRRLAERDGRSPDDLQRAGLLSTAGMAELQAGAPERAEELLRECLRVHDALAPPNVLERAGALTLYGLVLQELDRLEEARSTLERALAIRREHLPEHWLCANTESVLGGCLTRLGRFAEAEPLLVGAVPRLEQVLGAGDFRTRDAVRRCAELYEAWGRPEDARVRAGR